MSLKKKLTQEDLRKAMNEHKKKLATVKGIESPLAKYTDAGELMCILCKTVIRSETVWVVHLNSKTHKNNIALAKKIKLETERSSINISSVKRPPSPLEGTNKKIKGILKNSNKPLVQSSLPADFFDSSSEHQSVAPPVFTVTAQNVENVAVQPNKPENKKDFGEREVEREKGKDGNQAVLPEGFFDDPILDAKVRNVEYKDPVEEEWEKFQKEIKEETAQSAQIIAEDQEEATTERQLDEIEEQMRYWSRVMDFVKRKDEVQNTDKQDDPDDETSSGDEAEFDEFLDWRAKNSYK